MMPQDTQAAPVRYVTFGDDGALTGCYLQVPLAEHAGHMIVVDESLVSTWAAYRANAARTGVELAPAAPTPAPTEDQYVDAIQCMLDAKVQERRYLNILSACSYAASTNATFKAEAAACMAWRDNVWATAYRILSAVQAGTQPQPTVAALLAMLPSLTWPT